MLAVRWIKLMPMCVNILSQDIVLSLVHLLLVCRPGVQSDHQYCNTGINSRDMGQSGWHVIYYII